MGYDKVFFPFAVAAITPLGCAWVASKFVNISNKWLYSGVIVGTAFLSWKYIVPRILTPMGYPVPFDAESFEAEARCNCTKEQMDEQVKKGLPLFHNKNDPFHDPERSVYSIINEMCAICGNKRDSWRVYHDAESKISPQKFRHKQTGEIATQISLLDMKNWDKMDAESFSADRVNRGLFCRKCNTLRTRFNGFKCKCEDKLGE